MAGLREKHKDSRRKAIVLAASSLLRERGIDGLSIPDIAARAEVSTATVYNLIGGQNAVAGALLASIADSIELGLSGQLPADPLEACLAFSNHVIDVFESRAAETRPILQLYLTKRGTPEWNAERPLFFIGERTVNIYGGLLARAQECGVFDPRLPSRAIADTMFATLKLRIDLWASGLVEAQAARAAAQKDILVILLSGAIEPTRERLLQKLLSLSI